MTNINEVDPADVEQDEEVHIIYVASSKRIIRAMRECAKHGGQGHSYDREAVQAAEQQRLLVWSNWPGGHWSITPKGLNFMVDCESNDNVDGDGHPIDE